MRWSSVRRPSLALVTAQGALGLDKFVGRTGRSVQFSSLTPVQFADQPAGWTDHDSASLLLLLLLVLWFLMLLLLFAYPSLGRGGTVMIVM